MLRSFEPALWEFRRGDTSSSSFRVLALSHGQADSHVLNVPTRRLLGIDLATSSERITFHAPPVELHYGIRIAVYVPSPPPFAVGELNCDGSVNPFNIQDFVGLLSP